MRILILGDSVTLHRARTGQSLLDIWPQLLKTKLTNADIWSRARANLTCRDIARELYLFSDSLDHLDYVVVQVGIVDASPRPHPYALQKLIWNVGSLGLERFVNHNMYKLLRIRSKPWISQARFRKELEYVAHTAVSSNLRTKVIFIAIAPPCHDMPHKLPGVCESVQDYNQILASFSQHVGWANRVFYTDPYIGKIPEEIIIKDGHHLNCAGHKIVADAVAKIIQQSITGKE